MIELRWLEFDDREKQLQFRTDKFDNFETVPTIKWKEQKCNNCYWFHSLATLNCRDCKNLSHYKELIQ